MENRTKQKSGKFKICKKTLKKCSGATIDKNKTTVKVSALWYFVEWYLEMLSYTGAKMDEEFSRYFNQLYDYVHGKIKTCGLNILDEYVVYEIEVDG